MWDDIDFRMRTTQAILNETQGLRDQARQQLEAIARKRSSFENERYQADAIRSQLVSHWRLLAKSANWVKA
jgi:hypothetical protein